MQVKKCLSYNAQLARSGELLTMPDGRSVFKVYFLSITGRQDRARYEWGVGSERPEDFLDMFRIGGVRGVGFLTVFKHITKVFRFAPAMETVMHVKALHTKDLKLLDLGREDEFLEFACYAEALLAASEYKAWAQADTVESYLEFIADMPDGRVLAHDKLANYFNGGILS